ncbi:MAG TPA: FAD-dependent oxidoreductase, partial [Solirubrobacteraceae bacterium]|nr:FAD-dependent oxidoreductase [Solirubrobacteraceae bacterium]
EARADWEIFARLAAELGFGDDFAWRSPAEVFDEFAACTEGRPCDVSGIDHELLRRRGGVQWGGARLYEDRRFPTPDGRARIAPTPHAGPAEAPGPDFPLTLTTGRVAAHWHTLTRTGKSEKLSALAGEPFVELHPADAARAGVHAGERARVVSARGEVLLRVRVEPGVPEGIAFAPFHWGALHAPAGAGQVNAATIDAVDPVSAQPELKAAAVRVEPAGRRAARRRLVVVGTGMAAMETVEELLRRADNWRITMLGEEPVVPYNRMLLSKLLARAVGPGGLELRPPAWFAQHDVDLRGGCAARSVDVAARRVRDSSGIEHAYDALVLATGSRPFLPPIPGADGPRVLTFRTRADVAAIASSAVPARRVVVIGGGLLGLEAAAGVRGCGAVVTVLEAADRLMPQQLDAAASAMLARALVGLGIEVRTGARVTSLEPGRVRLAEEVIDADLVVVAAGVRPETALAAAAGLEVERGIVVDDAMRASAPGVWAVGECAQHRGTVYGLWAPLAEQARVAGAAVCGDPAAFHGAVTATSLKVADVDVFAGGEYSGADELVWSDSRRGVYRRLVLRGDRLAGAILVGDASVARELSALLRAGGTVPDHLLAPPGAADAPPAPRPDDVVCACNGVRRDAIEQAIAAGALDCGTGVSRATRAASGCGSCASEIEAILRSRSRNAGVTEAKLRSDTIPA